jgi:predicted metalloenzyme YecM
MREIIGDYEPFIENINHGLAAVGIIETELAMMDHICYRVETEDRYQEMFAALGQACLLLGEASVGGRLIATFEFKKPLVAGGWFVPYLELPQPKDGSPYPEGLEHAEFVVIGGLDRFAERHSELPFNRSGMSKQLNPELGLKTAGMSVKFHEQPLGAVVRIEQRLGLA